MRNGDNDCTSTLHPATETTPLQHHLRLNTLFKRMNGFLLLHDTRLDLSNGLLRLKRHILHIQITSSFPVATNLMSILPLPSSAAILRSSALLLSNSHSSPPTRCG